LPFVVSVEGANTPFLFHRQFDAQIGVVEKPFIFNGL